MSVVFPAPVGPQIPTFCPCFISAFMSVIKNAVGRIPKFHMLEGNMPSVFSI